MKRRFFDRKVFGIYGKVLSYTLLILLFVVGVAAMFFSGQIAVTIDNLEREQFTNIFSSLASQLGGKSKAEVIVICSEFHQNFPFLEISVQTLDGEVFFKTDNATVPVITNGIMEITETDYSVYRNETQAFQMVLPLSDGSSIHVAGMPSGTSAYSDFIIRTVLVLFGLFLIGTLAAALFAHRITKPIKNIAQDTKRMLKLEFVPPPVERRDEIGQLALDVYKMYEELKAEIEREREMEENQRYFFSAASHELKTPIASTMLLLQGMLDNVGDFKDHLQYLRECIKKMETQNRLISEILEIVKLGDGKITPNYEKIELVEVVKSVADMHSTISEASDLFNNFPQWFIDMFTEDDLYSILEAASPEDLEEMRLQLETMGEPPEGEAGRHQTVIVPPGQSGSGTFQMTEDGLVPIDP